MKASLNEKLKNVKWGEYELGTLFDVQSSKKRFDANKVTLVKHFGHPYIVRQSTDNGQKGKIAEAQIFLNPGNTISFGQDTATIFYQEHPYFTGDKIKILKSKYPEFRKENAQFFLLMMRKSFSSFSWGGSKFNVATLKKQSISLPTKDGKIDFDFMEAFIKALEADHIISLTSFLNESSLNTYNLSADEVAAISKLPTVQWKKYKMGDLFCKIKTKKLPYQAKELPDSPIGKYTLPCLTSSFMNQGLNYYAPKDGATILKDVISIPSNSDVYRAYYQSREFTVLSDAYAIRWNYNDQALTPRQYLFMVMCINKVTDLPIYSYKNKLGGWNVVKNKYIQLPVVNGEIDLGYMDTLISAIQKIAIKDVVLYSQSKR